MGVTGKKVERLRIGVEPAQWQGPVLRNFIMVAEVYLPPTTTRGTWAPMSPAQVDPG